jgi:hypothetical protein
MPNDAVETFGSEPLQEFVGPAIDDPAVLAALEKKTRRAARQSPRLWALAGAAALVAALVAGVLLGRYILTGGPP